MLQVWLVLLRLLLKLNTKDQVKIKVNKRGITKAQQSARLEKLVQEVRDNQSSGQQKWILLPMHVLFASVLCFG